MWILLNVIVDMSIASLCELSKVNRFKLYCASEAVWFDMHGEYSVHAQSSIYSVVLLFCYSTILLFQSSLGSFLSGFHNHFTLSVTMETTQWLKQPIPFCIGIVLTTEV